MLQGHFSRFIQPNNAAKEMLPEEVKEKTTIRYLWNT